MKRKITAFVLAAMMAVSGLSLPVFARYEYADSTYEYIDTEDLRVSYDEGTGKYVLTWPAVDTNGNLITANRLRAEGQERSTGNPTASWTFPTNGMIIAFNGWTPSGLNEDGSNVTAVSSDDRKPDHQIIKGIVDYETDYPINIYDQSSGAFVKKAYIDPTVVADSYATSYRIQYSKDGLNWEDPTADNWTFSSDLETVNHGGKKISHVIDDTIPDQERSKDKDRTDRVNTTFLEDQLTTELVGSFEGSTKYYVRVLAFNAKDSKSVNTPYKIFMTEFTTQAEAILTPAFPTVEGGGVFSQGGRGTEKQQGDVYVVTDLGDSVSDPQPGTLRYGLERRDRADGNKLYPRTIVFAVGGTIHIDPTATKGQRRFNINSNTTIAGQTAPGDGITIAGASAKFEGSNIIARYIRFRLGSGYDLDGGTASGENIVIDHCTFSYGVDEVFSAKELVNSSFQYNIINSGLSIPDKDGINSTDNELGEDTAKHGMGSIINGNNASYTHNLWSNNGTRNPRFEGGFSSASGIRYENLMDFDNNVIYNWGHGSGYGGERGNGLVNFENNYFKPGPNTLAKVKDLFYECYSGSYKSSYYINGNIMEGNDEVTADNTKGFKGLGSIGLQLDAKADYKNNYEPEPAEDAYQHVLDTAGASLHRDAWDNCLIEQVKNNTGYFINSHNEAGGFNTEVYEQPKEYEDTDKDGLPDKWEDEHGLDKNNGKDSTLIVTENDADKYGGSADPYLGYTHLEVYLNTITNEWAPTGLKYNTTHAETAAKAVNITAVKDSNGKELDLSTNLDLVMGETYTLETDDTASNGFEVYLNERKIADGKDGKAEFTPDKNGHAYLMIKSLGSSDVFNDPVKIFSAGIRTTVTNTPAAAKTFIDNLGDVNCDGEIKADDSALTLQYVLNKSSVKISNQGLRNAQVADGEIDASFSAAILQKALVSTFKFKNSTAVQTEDENAGPNLEGFSSSDIGLVRAPGYDFYDPATNSLITEGNGYLGRTGSSSNAKNIDTEEGFHYNYKQISGDVTITAKIYNWAKIDYYQMSGIMLAGDLTGTGEYYSAGMTYLKDEDYEGSTSISGSKRFEGRNIAAAYREKAGERNSSFYHRYLGVPQAKEGEAQIGGWAKAVKEGNKVTLYASLDGRTWYELYTSETTLPDKYYIGFATSSAQDSMDLATYNKSLITDIDIQYSAVYPN